MQRHVFEVGVGVDLALVVPREPLLLEALADAANHAVGQPVDGSGHAPRLLQHHGLALKGEEAVDVGTGPQVQRLVRVARHVGPLACFDQQVHQLPLHAREVLRLVHDHHVQVRQQLWPVARVVEHVGEVDQAVRFLEVPQCAVHVLKMVPLDLEVGAVVVHPQVFPCKAGHVDGVDDGVVCLHRAVVVDHVADLNARELGKLEVVLGLHDLSLARAKDLEGQAVQRAEVGEVDLGFEVRKLDDGAVARLVRGLSGERKVANSFR